MPSSTATCLVSNEFSRGSCCCAGTGSGQRRLVAACGLPVKTAAATGRSEGHRSVAARDPCQGKPPHEGVSRALGRGGLVVIRGEGPREAEPHAGALGLKAAGFPGWRICLCPQPPSGQPPPAPCAAAAQPRCQYWITNEIHSLTGKQEEGMPDAVACGGSRPWAGRAPVAHKNCEPCWVGMREPKKAGPAALSRARRHDPGPSLLAACAPALRSRGDARGWV